MRESNWRQPLMLLITGLSLGVAATFGGLYFANSGPAGVGEQPTQAQLSALLLHATGADSGESFALATGPIDDEVEGIFALDFATGELNIWVVSPRAFTFLAQFKHNVIADLNVDMTKAPKFVMVSGSAAFSSRGSAVAPANSVIYVADANSGNIAAYGIPWSRAAQTSGKAQGGPLRLLEKFVGRSAILPE